MPELCHHVDFPDVTTIPMPTWLPVYGASYLRGQCRLLEKIEVIYSSENKVRNQLKTVGLGNLLLQLHAWSAEEKVIIFMLNSYVDAHVLGVCKL